MYEAPITDYTQDETLEGSRLRALQWPELVAKLAAMRDLRLSLAGQQGHSTGAFSGFADIREKSSHEPDAQYLENRDAAPESQSFNETGRSVNLKTLADRKGPAPNDEALNTQDMQSVPPATERSND